MQEPYVVASWPSVPVEILRATGFRPVFARGAADPTPAADAHLEPRIFPNRLRRLVEDALTGRLSSAARIVIPRTSDADYKCFLYLREFVRRGMATAVAPIVAVRPAAVGRFGRAGTTTWCARVRCSTSWPRRRAGCRLPTIFAARSRERMPPVRRPAAWSRFAVIVPRVTGNRRLSIARGILGDGTGALRGDGTRRCRHADLGSANPNEDWLTPAVLGAGLTLHQPGLTADRSRTVSRWPSDEVFFS